MRFALLAIIAAGAAALPTGEQDVAARTSVDACPGCDPRDVAVAPILMSRNIPRNETVDMIEVRMPAEGAPKAQLEEVEIEEKTTKSGKKYRVHRPKGSAAAEAAAKKEHSKRGSEGHFMIPVYWRAGQVGMTDAGFTQTTGINQWAIDIGGVFYKYRINFHTVDAYNYYFEDEEGDWYNCNVWRPGSHYIDYNSHQPNIVAVQGTGI